MLRLNADPKKVGTESIFFTPAAVREGKTCRKFVKAQSDGLERYKKKGVEDALTR